MEEIQERIRKLKMSSLNDLMAQANEEAAESKPSLRTEIEKTFEVFKRKARDARQIATNEERSIAFKVDNLKSKNDTNIEKKNGLEKIRKEAKSQIDFIQKNIESYKAMALDSRLPEKRKNFVSIETRLAKAFDDFANKETLRNELLRICCQSGTALIDCQVTEDFKIVLVDRSDIQPISISKKCSPDELRRRTVEACQMLHIAAEKKQGSWNRRANKESSYTTGDGTFITSMGSDA